MHVQYVFLGSDIAANIANLLVFLEIIKGSEKVCIFFLVLSCIWSNLQIIDKHMLTQCPLQISPLSFRAVASVVAYLKILIIDVNTGYVCKLQDF